MRSIVFIRDKNKPPSTEIVNLLASLKAKKIYPVDWHYDSNYVTFRVEEEDE